MLSSGPVADPLVSLCIIARDEAPRLTRCLSSAAGVAAERIVVDTGSTDDTVEVAERFGAIVSHFPWTDDFAAARNASLSLATGRWILVMDADEELETPDAGRLLRWLESAPGEAYQVELVNLDDAGQEGERVPLLRLWWRAAGLRYTGAIHEQLERQGGPVHSDGIAPGLRLRHYGYQSGLRTSRDKLVRNRRLLEKALVEEPDDAYLRYQLGLTLFLAGEYPEAWTHLELALLAAPESPLVRREAGYCLKTLNRHAEALAVVEAGLEAHPQYTDLAFLRGLLLMEQGEFAGAAEAFGACLAAGEAPARYQSRRGVGTFLAAHNLGVLHEVLGQQTQAAEAYRLALAFNSAFGPARDRLAAVMGPGEVSH